MRVNDAANELWLAKWVWWLLWKESLRHELSSRYPWVQRYVHQSEICVSQLKPQNRKPLFVLPLHSLPRAASRGKCCASFGCSRTTWEAVFLLGNSKQPYTTRTFYGLKTVLDSSWWPLNPAEIFASKSFFPLLQPTEGSGAFFQHPKRLVTGFNTFQVPMGKHHHWHLFICPGVPSKNRGKIKKAVVGVPKQNSSSLQVLKWFWLLKFSVPTRTRLIQPLPPPPLQMVFLGHGFHRSKMDPLKQQLTIHIK